ncbi:MAG TPA: hypothetical protein DDY04_00985 [Bacteroidales bacterium]|nr:hypothetical protein [Bacteroidales bacterium]
MNTILRITIGSALILLQSHISLAQDGYPFVTHFEYSSRMVGQNIDFAQDKNGLVYVLNLNGLFSFDGSSWTYLPTPGKAHAVEKIGDVYVAGENFIGYYEENLKGNSVFTLVDGTGNDVFYRLCESGRGVTFALGIKGIYRISRAEPRKASLYYAESDSSMLFTDIFSIGDLVFGVKNNQFLFQILSQNAREYSTPLSGDEYFSFSLTHAGKQLLVTNRNRLFWFDGNRFIPFKVDDKQLPKENRITDGVSVNDNTLAFSTLFGGVVLVNPNTGLVKQVIDVDSGLPDNEVSLVSADDEKGLWIFHELGASRFDFDIPVKSFDRYPGLNGNILSVCRFGQLYVGTSNGLYRLDVSKTYKTVTVERELPVEPVAQAKDLQTSRPKKRSLLDRILGRSEETPDEINPKKTSPSKPEKRNEVRKITRQVFTGYAYQRVDGVSGRVNQLIVNSNCLFASSNRGLYCIKDSKVQTIISGKPIHYISAFNDDFLLVGSGSQLYRVSENNGEFEVSSIVSVPKGKINSALHFEKWLFVSTDDKVFRYELNNPQKTPDELNVPEGLVLPSLCMAKGKPYVVTINAIYQINNQFDSLVKQSWGNTELKLMYAGAKDFYLKQGSTWLNFTESDTTNSIIPNLGLLDKVSYVSRESNRTLWAVTGYRQIYRIDAPTDSREKTFAIKIIQVSRKNGEILNTRFSSIPEKKSAISITLQAPFYLKNEGVEYQYFVKGSMDAWSDWQSSPIIEFPFFAAGNHEIQLRARNAQGIVSQSVAYNIYSKPIFYKTFWFYSLLAAFIFIMILLYIKQRERKLIKENRELEKKVRERTKTIQEQKEEIEAQRDQLQIRNEEILQQKEEIEAQRDEIMEQRDKIITQNQEIIKSISYALRIQRAVMPTHDKVSTTLNDFFIFLKPRDIVSGDFYWIAQRDHKVVLAVADCTGHGVPGAFMSLLGITLLDEIVNRVGNIQPDIILGHLREYIKRALSQEGKEHETKDGMDIALAVIDTATMQLQFSGAYNPIYIIRKGKLTELKGDKMPVGIHLSERKDFTLHNFQLSKGDCLYMFSDGYVDQFGGDNNRKFMAKNFRELLVRTSPLPMADQYKELEDTLDRWMGGTYEQTDDILVFGLRV